LIPFILTLCSYVYGYNYFGAISNSNYLDPNSNHIVFISLLVCYIVVIIYGLYPIRFNKKRYAKGYQDIVVEFEFIKKTLFVAIPILITLTIIDQLFTYLQISSYIIGHYLILYAFSFSILVSSMAVVTGAPLRVLTHAIKKEFRLYLAKGSA
jgi:hypothetical protein